MGEGERERESRKPFFTALATRTGYPECFTGYAGGLHSCSGRDIHTGRGSHFEVNNRAALACGPEPIRKYKISPDDMKVVTV